MTTVWYIETYLNKLGSKSIVRLLSKAASKAGETIWLLWRHPFLRIQLVRVSKSVENIIILLSSLSVIQRRRALVSGLRVDSGFPTLRNGISKRRAYLTSEKERMSWKLLGTEQVRVRDSMVDRKVELGVLGDPNNFTSWRWQKAISCHKLI